MSEQTNIPRAQWEEFLQETRDPGDHYCYTEVQMVNYADCLLTFGEEAASNSFPEMHQHMATCPNCKSEIDQMIELVENAGGG